MTPETARKTWRTAEPIHAFIYFLPEASEAYDALGSIGPRTGYFASRSAAMGAVPAEVVVSTFYNFNPRLVHDAMTSAWSVASPAKWCDTRLAAVDTGLRRAWGGAVDTPEVRELAAILPIAAEKAQRYPVRLVGGPSHQCIDHGNGALEGIRHLCTFRLNLGGARVIPRPWSDDGSPARKIRGGGRRKSEGNEAG